MNLISNKLLAQVVGQVKLPQDLNIDTSYTSGITGLLTRILQLVFVAGGIWALISFIIAGFQFMTAGGDAKNITKAWDRIWQTFVGLIIIVASFALAALIGQLLFRDPTFILSPKIYGPGQ